MFTLQQKDNGMIVAYMNEKQEVFLSVSRYKFAPFFQNLLVLMMIFQ